MKYKYEFANENKTIEISEEWISVLEELDRLEYNNNHAETRRHVSLDDGEDGEWLSTERGEVYIRCAGQIFSRHDDRFDDGRRSLSEKQDELYESRMNSMNLSTNTVTASMIMRMTAASISPPHPRETEP